jgi:tRNA pseudouridine32 synthase/23S rRNA pseudouridine746 synthase
LLPEEFVPLTKFFNREAPADHTVVANFQGVCPSTGRILSIPRTALAEMAAQRLMETLPAGEPKMFGVLLVRAKSGELGLLRAFSGKLDGRFHHPGWVPPMLELRPSELEVSTKRRLADLKQQLQELSQSALYRNRRSVRIDWERRSLELEKRLKTRKKERDKRRAAGVPEAELASLSKHDSREKREFKRNKSAALGPLDRLEEQIKALKSERKSISRTLQQELHDRFEAELWNDLPWSLASLFPSGPPTGTGECCAPKLLHFARRHGLQPVALAEFWWGESTDNRRRGEFYSPCEERCRPLLGPLLSNATLSIPVVYHDQHMVVVDKPSGLLTVPGRQNWNQDSVVRRLQDRWGPLFPVHRLDLDTSGLVILARDSGSQGKLQKQFSQRRVKKCYQALLKDLPDSSSGQIARPIEGKDAVTNFRLLNARKKRIELRPLTGRTHQLRVHCARDLKCPIQGDRVYGDGAGPRLMLHARELEFVHPFTGKSVQLESVVPF